MNPVLLVHGLGDTGAVFDRMAGRLRDRGHEVHALSLTPSNGDAPLETLAEQVGAFAVSRFGHAGARQMRPDSMFLADLNRDVESLRRIRTATIWTPLDLMIVPATSGTRCPGRSLRVTVPAHPLMLHDGRVLRLVHGILTDAV